MLKLSGFSGTDQCLPMLMKKHYDNYRKHMLDTRLLTQQPQHVVLLLSRNLLGSSRKVTKLDEKSMVLERVLLDND